MEENILKYVQIAECEFIKKLTFVIIVILNWIRMTIKFGDKFEEKDEGIIWIIDKIEGNWIYHHTIGRYSTLPNSEIKRRMIIEKLIENGVIKKIEILLKQL